ncbi:MAG: hypothetical protein K8L91_19885 [Anaerolineae bacterium]|nr:hypothetical protein [Anaerolineae bacterium]
MTMQLINVPSKGVIVLDSLVNACVDGSETLKALNQRYLETLLGDHTAHILLPAHSERYPNMYCQVAINPELSPNILAVHPKWNMTNRFTAPELPVTPSHLILPIFNIGQRDEALDDAKQRQFLCVNIGWSPFWYGYDLKIIVLCINHLNEKRFADFSDVTWWLTEELSDEESRQKLQDAEIQQKLRETIKVIECTSDELSVNLLKDVLSLALEAPIITETTQSYSRDFDISLQNIGIDESAKWNFIIGAVHTLAVQNIPFTIWVDAMLVPRFNGPNEYKDRDGNKFQEWVGTLRQIEADQRYHLLFGKHILAKQQIELQVNQLYEIRSTDHFRLSAAYFGYIEINGLVYDNFKAFSQPIPLHEYQAKINPDLRHKLEFNGNLTPTEAVAKVEHLLEYAKYQVSNPFSP